MRNRIQQTLSQPFCTTCKDKGYIEIKEGTIKLCPECSSKDKQSEKQVIITKERAEEVKEFKEQYKKGCGYLKEQMKKIFKER